MTKTIVFCFAVLLSLCASLCAQQATVRPGDSFDLRISGVPSDDQANISTNYTVDEQGFFNIAYVGQLKVSGKTAGEIQSLVERTFIDKQIFTHPTVTLTIAPSARFVNVGGPGINGGGKRIPYTADMTLMSAIVAAGDFNEFADQKHVNLTRGKQLSIINCKDVRRNPTKDITMLPGDTVQVPESAF